MRLSLTLRSCARRYALPGLRAISFEWSTSLSLTPHLKSFPLPFLERLWVRVVVVGGAARALARSGGALAAVPDTWLVIVSYLTVEERLSVKW